MLILKVLTKDLKSPHKNYQWELGKQVVCKDFDNDPKRDCSNGFYGTEIEGLPYAFRHKKGHCVFEIEMSGKNVNYNIYKRRWQKAKLTGREFSYDEIKQMAKEHEKICGYKLSEVLFPINPLTDIAKYKVTKIDIENLRKWKIVSDSVSDSVSASVSDSVSDSVYASVYASVSASVYVSVYASVSASVSRSVGDSVRASVYVSVYDSVYWSVYAYISGLFPNIKKWKYIDHKKGVNPFQSCIDLWKRGFMPVFDGKTWHLCQGKNAEIVYSEVIK